MNNKLSQIFDARYQQHNHLFGNTPVDLVIKATSILTKNTQHNKTLRALDLGAGNGRNTIYLLKQGFYVTAVDISGEALKLLKKEAVLIEKEDFLTTFKGSVMDFLFEIDYDLILGIGLLHFLSKQQIDLLIQRSINHTNILGLNVWIARMQQNHRNSLSFVFPKHILKEYYTHLEDWKILHYEETNDRASIISQKITP